MKPDDLPIPSLLPIQALLIEDLGKLLDSLTLPGRDLGRMDSVLGRQLRNPLVALNRLKCNLGLELSRKPSPRPHGGSSSSLQIHLNRLSHEVGPPLNFILVSYGLAKHV